MASAACLSFVVVPSYALVTTSCDGDHSNSFLEALLFSGRYMQAFQFNTTGCADIIWIFAKQGVQGSWRYVENIRAKAFLGVTMRIFILLKCSLQSEEEINLVCIGDCSVPPHIPGGNFRNLEPHTQLQDTFNILDSLE